MALIRLLCALAVLLFFCGCTALESGDSSRSIPLDRALVCAEQDQDRIIIMADDRDWSKKENLLWSWRAAGDPGIRRDHLRWFNNPDECKVVNHGKGLLITASGGVVALLSIPENRVIFYARAGKNPHSAVLLPDGNIAAPLFPIAHQLARSFYGR